MFFSFDISHGYWSIKNPLYELKEHDYTGCFKKSFTILKPLPVSCIWTCSKSSSFHSWTKMTKKDALTSSKTVHPLITLEKCASISGQWIGRAAPIAWPPRSPDLTPMDFFLWGFGKDQVFIPPLPANVVELRT